MHKVIAALILLSMPAFSADKVPSWLEAIVTRETPKYEVGVPAVVLFQETKLTVYPDGKVLSSVRRALKILARDGRHEAVARVVYKTDAGKVRDLRAWVSYPSGEAKEFGKKDIIDLSLAENDVYNESRVQVISRASAVDPGTVFGYESLLEDRSIFTQISHDFQDELPVLISRFILELPAGWTAQALMSNHKGIEPQLNGSTYTWQVENLPPIDEEPARPSLSSLVPRLNISYFPPSDMPGTVQTFKNWQQVSAWLDSIQTPQSNPDAAVTAQAQKLVAGKQTEMERIRAIARFVQDIKYVSIQIGLGRGGGYKPHAAGDVLQKSYGDCKDKANLMRTMLKAIGIESHPVAVYAGDRYYVREDWASPQQFNHAIIAIHVPADIRAPAVFEHARLGRLLFFDPTDSYTTPGFLPSEEQDSLALVVSPESVALTRLPSASPEDNLLKREVKASLMMNGSLKAGIREACSGSTAGYNRSLYGRLSPEEYRKMIEHWITHGAPGSEVTKIEAGEKEDDGFFVSVDLTALTYARKMGGQLMIFKPAVVGRLRSTSFTENTRKYPVVLDADVFTESAEFELPEGFDIDEIPEPVTLETAFGKYTADWRFEDDKVYFNRAMKIRNAILDPKDYPSVKDFFNRMIAAEQAPVVLSLQ
jgi:hypothetical protein